MGKYTAADVKKWSQLGTDGFAKLRTDAAQKKEQEKKAQEEAKKNSYSYTVTPIKATGGKGPISLSPSAIGKNNLPSRVAATYKPAPSVSDYSEKYEVNKKRQSEEIKNIPEQQLVASPISKNSIPMNTQMTAVPSFALKEKRLKELEKEMQSFDWNDPIRNQWAENYANNPNWTDNPDLLQASKEAFDYVNRRKAVETEYLSLAEQLKQGNKSGIHRDSSGNIDSESGIAEARRERDIGITAMRPFVSHQDIFTMHNPDAASPEARENFEKVKEYSSDVALASDKIEAYKYYEENKGKEYADNPFGRFAGNYKLGRTGIKGNEAAFTSYSASSDDLEAYDIYQELNDKIRKNSISTFTDKTAVDFLISTFGQYAPQGLDQLTRSGAGWVVGAVSGNALLGNLTGSGLVAQYMYGQTAGDAYARALKTEKLTVDEAKKVAKSEATISAVIEFGLELAGGALIDGIKSAKGAVKSVAKNGFKKACSELAEGAAKKLISKLTGESLEAGAKAGSKEIVEALVKSGLDEKTAVKVLNAAKNIGKFALSSGSEGMEEYLQEAVSIASDRLTKEGKAPGMMDIIKEAFNFEAYTEDDLKRMNQSFLGGLIIGTGHSSAQLAFNAGWSTSVNKLSKTVEAGNFGSTIMETRNPDAIIEKAIDFGTKSENRQINSLAARVKSIYNSGNIAEGDNKLFKKSIGELALKLTEDGQNIFNDRSIYNPHAKIDILTHRIMNGLDVTNAELMLYNQTRNKNRFKVLTGIDLTGNPGEVRKALNNLVSEGKSRKAVTDVAIKIKNGEAVTESDIASLVTHKDFLAKASGIEIAGNTPEEVRESVKGVVAMLEERQRKINEEESAAAEMRKVEDMTSPAAVIEDSVGSAQVTEANDTPDIIENLTGTLLSPANPESLKAYKGKHLETVLRLLEDYDIRVNENADHAEYIPNRAGTKDIIVIRNDKDIAHELTHAILRAVREGRLEREKWWQFWEVRGRKMCKEIFAELTNSEFFINNVLLNDEFKESLFGKEAASEIGTYEEFYEAMDKLYGDDFRAEFTKEGATEEELGILVKEAIEEEIFAFGIQQLDEVDPGALERMTAQDGKLGRLIKRIAEFFKGIINSLKGETEPYYLKEVRRIADKFNALYEKEYASQNKKGEGKVKYSIKVNEKIGKVAFLDGKSIPQEQGEKLNHAIRRFFNENFKGHIITVFDNNDELSLDQIGKYLYARHKIEHNYEKRKIVAILDELIAIADNKSWSKNLLDKDGNVKKHAGLDCSNGFNYYDTKFAIDNSGIIWGGTIIARIDKNNDIYFYDLDNIREVGYMDVKNFNPTSSDTTSPIDNNISQPETIVNTNSTQNSENDASSDENNSGIRKSKQKTTPATDETVAAKKETVANTEEDLTYTERVKKNQGESRKALFERFSVPVNARSEVSSLLRAAYSTIDRGGTVSERVKKVIYDTLIENSVVIDDSMRRNNEDFIDYFKGRTLRVDDGVLSEFSGGSWNSAFGKVAGKFTIRRNYGSDISVIYREACELFPGLLYPFSDNASDQLQEIVDVLNSLKPEKMGILESAKRDNISEAEFIEFLESNLEEYRVRSGIAKLEKGRPISGSEIEYLASNHADEVSAALGINLKTINPSATLKNFYERSKGEKLEEKLDRILNLNRDNGVLVASEEFKSFLSGIDPENSGVELTLLQKNQIKLLKNLGSMDWNQDIFRNLDKMAGGKDTGLRSFLRFVIENPFLEAKRNYKNAVRERLTDYHKKMVKDLGIDIGSRESAAVQWYGEGCVIVDGKEVKYDLDSLKRDFPDSWEKIVEADKYNREIYNEYIKRINDKLVEIYPYVEREVEKLQKKIREIESGIDGASPEVRRKGLVAIASLQTKIDNLLTGKRLRPLKNYYRHFREMSQGFEGFINLIKSSHDIDPRLVGVSDNTKPKGKWWSALQHRDGPKPFRYDAVASMLDYVKAAEYKVNIEPFVAHMRRVLNTFANEIGHSEANRSLEYLIEWTNTLVGKTNFLDRAVQKIVGRKTIAAMNFLSSRVKSNSILLNFRSAVVQIANLPNAAMYIKNPVYWNRALRAAIHHDNSIKASAFLGERYLDDVTALFEKPGLKKAALKMLSFGDEVATKFIWRAAYEQGLALKVEDAVKYADNIARRCVGGRGIGELPVMQESKFVKTFAPFQIEVTNLFNLFREKFGDKDALGYLLWAISSWLMNELYRFLFNDTVTPDFINAGVEVADIVSDDEIEDKNMKVLGRVAGEFAQALPFASQIVTLLVPDEKERETLFGDVDPTRYGTGVIGFSAMWDAAKGIATLPKNLFSGEFEKAMDGLMPLLTNYLLPYGGRQGQRIYETAKAYIKGGSYKINSEGEKQLRFPLNANIEDGLSSFAFGPYASRGGRKYVEDLDTLSASETKAYNYLVKVKKQDNISVYNAIMSYDDFRQSRGTEVLKKNFSYNAYKNSAPIDLRSEAAYEEEILKRAKNYKLTKKDLDDFIAEHKIDKSLALTFHKLMTLKGEKFDAFYDSLR